MNYHNSPFCILDVNECELNLSACPSNEECINTIGSFKCLIICRNGYERSEDELYCKGMINFYFYHSISLSYVIKIFYGK